MKLFRSKKEGEIKDITMNQDKKEETKIFEQPRICSVDLKEEDIDILKKCGFTVYNGSIGSKIRVPNLHNKNHELLLNYDLPDNLHEYDIILIDLEGSKTLDYNPSNHLKTNHTGKTSTSILSSYPQTLFDPRPMIGTFLKDELAKITNRKHLILVFSCAFYEIEYELVEISERSYNRGDIEKHNIYSFRDYIQFSTQKFGKEMRVCEINTDLKTLLEKHLKDSVYNQTFHHPTYYKGYDLVEEENYLPLIKNMNGDIVSFLETNEFENLIMLPQIKEKGAFLKDFLTKIAPSSFPELFPYSSTFEWKNNKDYWLPNHEALLNEKNKIQEEFEYKLNQNQIKIDENLNTFSFLQNILTETGDNLVESLIEYFKWLGFQNIIDYDQTKEESKILEEDIQIEIENGLLIIECKGVGGTSTDSDCNQISKIKHRRCRERNKFDVFALYIVNHQRYLPPLNRQNPPFTSHQTEDALSDERGLLTTWQLFNLYFDIENNIISKSDARKTITNYGLIDFRPANLKFLYKPTEFFQDNKICIVNVENILLKRDQDIYVEKNGRFEITKLLDIQSNSTSVAQSNNGELGLKFNKKISKKSILWIKENFE
ncbi:hypothetical protein [Flavobacterium sp. KACC 22763]|uniref:hypothetical protein n=1 Tax=Flavobacterium sp. KACC 22763 TaxID=3025668 RepID=UPI0023671D6A|nr:hypothetical protein [Flavobacterium sp. KACC 22763]WDF66566.1 hypothetical protein PQ463_10435 [Flavobacterium sp. KACC 22763]